MNKITYQMVRDFLYTFPRFREPAMKHYIAQALDRFTYTLNQIPQCSDSRTNKMLEIGGAPYCMTVLIKKFLDYDIQVIDQPIFPEGQNLDKSQVIFQKLTNDEGETFTMSTKSLNIEYDQWPYQDSSFDFVIYCEVIEHLVSLLSGKV